MRRLAALPNDTTILTTNYGDFLVGSSASQTLAMQAGLIGLISMEGDDTLNGGAGDDQLFGDYAEPDGSGLTLWSDPSVSGNDAIYGGAGRDSIWGGPGDNLLDGGDDSDVFIVLTAMPGNDTIYGGAGDDTLQLLSDEWDGWVTEIVFGTLTLDLAASVESLVAYGRIDGTSGANQFDLSGVTEYIFSTQGSFTSFSGIFDLREGDDHFTGGASWEYVWGGAGADTLIGGDGSDTLRGGAGNDSVDGGLGDDTLVVEEAFTGTDSFFGGDGYDELWAGSPFVPANYTKIIFNTLILNAAASVEKVLQVKDMVGTLGDDVFDLSGVSFYASSIWGEVGRFDLRAGNDLFTGGSANESLTGGLGNDTLIGAAGNDNLSGGLGNDALYGGDGDDEFTLDQQNAGTDLYYGGEGSDRIYIASFDFVESFDTISFAKLILDAKAGIESFATEVDVTGTDAANMFNMSGVLQYYFGSGTEFGASNSGFFNLGSGNDKFIGGQGQENVLGMNGRDLMLGGDGDDVLDGGAGNDTLQGQGGNDVLKGSSGDDSMLGGSGNDSYFVDSVKDAVVEQVRSGVDTVVTRLATYHLGADVENLTGSAGGGFTGMGNGLANILTGGKGADRLTGGAGLDTFVFNTALGGGNVDTITDFRAADDTIALEDAVFRGLTTVTAAQFKIIGAGGDPVDATDRILYEASTGKILFDSDGSGAKAAIWFATITEGAQLTAADFAVL